jgi:hypothetical protein
MKRNLLLGLFFIGSVTLLRGDDVLPKQEKFSRYEPMLKRSPFAVASAGAPVGAAPDFAKDLYLANAALSDTDNSAFITVASTTDRNFKEYLSTKGGIDGFSIVSIQWSDRVGETKATIAKDGQVATLSFNEAVLSQAIPGSASQTFQPMQRPGQPPMGVPMQLPRPMTIPSIPMPQPRTRGIIRRNALGDQRRIPTPRPVQSDDSDE